MNFQKLENDFKIRYNTTSNPSCTFAGTALFLLGDITCNCNNLCLITALSSGTALAIGSQTENNIFSIQETTDNLALTCKTEKLSSYHEENYAKPLFKIMGEIISYFNTNITGSELLFEHNTTEKLFHNPSAALVSALRLLYLPSKTPKEIISSLTNINLSKKSLCALLATLVSKREHCVQITNPLSDYKQFHLPIYGKKIIIIKDLSKRLYMSIRVENAYASFKKYMSLNNYPPTLNSSIQSSDIPISKYEKKLLTFLINEKNRIEKYPRISGYNDLCDIINESGSEILSLCRNEYLHLLSDAVCSTGLCSVSRPIPDSSAIYCIVDDDLIDDFIKKCADEYEKKAGYKPTFYISNTVSGGIEVGFKH